MTDDELIQGGQGREPQEISDALLMTCFSVGAAVMVVILSVMVLGGAR